MALIICPECGQQISNEAAACPKCGFPSPAMDVSWKISVGATIGGILSSISLLVLIGFTCAWINPLSQGLFFDATGKYPERVYAGFRLNETSAFFAVLGVYAAFAIYYLLRASYAGFLYPKYFTDKRAFQSMKSPLVFYLFESSTAISYLNGFFGGVVFGSLWNYNIARRKKGVSGTVATVVFAVLAVLQALFTYGLYLSQQEWLRLSFSESLWGVLVSLVSIAILVYLICLFVIQPRILAGQAKKYGLSPPRARGAGSHLWAELDRCDNRVLLITKDTIGLARFDTSTNDWATSEIHHFLNGEFLSSFTEHELSRIHKVDQGSVFLLSIDEAERYFSSDDRRIARAGRSSCSWWLRSPGSYGSAYAAFILDDGCVNTYGGDVTDLNFIRPALWINV